VLSFGFQSLPVIFSWIALSFFAVQHGRFPTEPSPSRSRYQRQPDLGTILSVIVMVVPIVQLRRHACRHDADFASLNKFLVQQIDNM
jgi:hypothetical protein